MNERTLVGGERPPEELVRLGGAAEGMVQPDEWQLNRLNEVQPRLLDGEFHQNLTDTVASSCIDGRCGGQSRASSAGGTISLMVATDLTQAKSDRATADLLGETIDRLHGRHLPIGDHGDDHASGEKTGCGANDNLSKIYKVMATKGTAIRDLARQIGFAELVLDDEVCQSIEQASASRTEFSSPAELTKVLLNTPDATVDTLHGDHNEAMIVINTQKDTTLDHQLMADELGGEDFEAFDVDAWAFEASARAVADDPEDEAEVKAKMTALLYYNLATALTLCGPDMPVVVYR